MTPDAPQTLRVVYDDQLHDVIDKVNRLLAAVGLRFVDDGQPHDGFMLYTLTHLDGGKDADSYKLNPGGQRA